MAQTWLEIATDARNSANVLLVEQRFRSSTSRAYYAAYSKITHEFVHIAGLEMPIGREGPSHLRIRRLIETSMPNMEQDKRVKLSELIVRLYTLRIDADYKPSVEIGSKGAHAAISILKKIFESF